MSQRLHFPQVPEVLGEVLHLDHVGQRVLERVAGEQELILREIDDAAIDAVDVHAAKVEVDLSHAEFQVVVEHDVREYERLDGRRPPHLARLDVGLCLTSASRVSDVAMMAQSSNTALPAM